MEPSLGRRTLLATLGSTGLLLFAPKSTASALFEQHSLETAVESLRTSMIAGDGDVLNSLLHDNLNYMHSSGHSQTKRNVLNVLAGKKFFASLTYSDLIIDIVANAGVVKFTADQVKNLPAGGTRPSRITVMQTWLRTEEAWRLLARSSALVSPAPTQPCRT